MKNSFLRGVIILLMLMIGWVVYGQTGVKQVAVLHPVDAKENVNDGIKLLLRSKVTTAIMATPGYGVYDRLDLSKILSEHEFQRTGVVDNAQIREIGKMGGISYLIIIEVANYDMANVILSARIIDVETVQLMNSAEEIAGISPDKMEQSCRSLVAKLLSPQSATDWAVKSSKPRFEDYTETVFGINMQMIWVEGGTFMMGCTSEQGSSCYDNEKNVHRVTLDGYYIGKFEVTQGQWEKVMGTSIYQQRNKANSSWPLCGVGSDYPMYCVSWEEATAFCEELSRRTGKKYRLPTEAQWEYAARDGNKNGGSKYSGSSSVDMVAWYDGNSGSSTHPVGTKRDNLLGLHDMCGNVWEWCRDRYASAYSYAESQNPQGPSGGSYRVIRGGSWGGDARICRVSARSGDSPGYRSRYFGFRVVCEP